MDVDDECDECMQPDCHFTPECTEQCLVLACDDPDHTLQACPDGTCTGLDDILQCCTDYYWPHSFPDWPCECTQDPPPSSLSQPLQAFISDSSISSSASSSPSLPPFSPQLHVPPPFPLQSFPCMWANCGSVFNSLSDLVGHVNLQHLCSPDTQIPPSPQPVQPQNDTHVFSQPPLSCHWGDCAAFPSPSSVPTSSSATSDMDVINILVAHLMQDHLGLNYPFPPFTTLQPPLTDPHDAPDTVHQPSLSPNPPPHDCSGTHICKWKACRESFSSCDDLTTHIASVHIGGGRARYECFWEGCSRHGHNGFSSKQKISRHLQSHTGHRPFQCQVCNQNFSEAATLQQHMRRHTREKPYLCDFPGCGKAFAITGALTIHKRTHNGLRPFKCKFCDRAFSESSNLSKHLRTHTGARPYECAEKGCKKAFARPDQLARHMNVHRKKNANG